MLTFQGVPEHPLGKATALTIGVFDGVHRGHAALIGRVVERAHGAAYAAGVVTFDPHPLAVLVPHVPLKYLCDVDERLARIEQLGVDFVVIMPFTHELSQTSARDFVRPLVERLKMRHLVIGHDFTLGHKRQGNEAFLRTLGNEWNFAVEAIEPVQAGEAVASSTRIRQLLASGKIATANEMLGYAYVLKGTMDHAGNFRVSGERQLMGEGHYQCTAYASSRRLPCAVEVRAEGLRVRWGGPAPGPMTLEFSRDATLEAEGFSEVEHTADVALRVRAATFPELLRQAALGMMELMTDAPLDLPTTAQQLVVVHTPDQAAALVDFLSEVLVLCETQHVLFTDFEVSEQADHDIRIVAHGAPARGMRKQVKAVTFHNLRVIQTEGGLETNIVFDV